MENNNSLTTLFLEMEWLKCVVSQCLATYFLQEGHEQQWMDIPVPDLKEKNCPYALTVSQLKLTTYGRLALALSIAPHFCPEALDIFFSKNQLYDRVFTEFGGIVHKDHSGFLPTGQTLCFLLTVNCPELRLEVMQLLGKDSLLIKDGIICLEETAAGVPWLSGLLSIDKGWYNYLLTGKRLLEENSASFPAQKMSTAMNWEDMVLDHQVLERVAEITGWLQHGNLLMQDWGLGKKLKPGYRALFYGPPGTGKTLTATMIGKSAGLDVYRIDLSMIVSKYIGETEKNLSRIFDVAQHKDWILFFDEADALFGKRTKADSSNDRHANQQTAYLLQRIEDFPGVVILATNLKDNMDEAFARRFQSVIHFNIPAVEERYALWQKAFSGVCSLHEAIDLDQIASEYELAGGAIINVLRFCALSAVRRNDKVVLREELLEGIKREFKKENRTLLDVHQRSRIN